VVTRHHQIHGMTAKPDSGGAWHALLHHGLWQLQQIACRLVHEFAQIPL
jgi:hypothetical protein